jgi:hypothetical protein
MNILINVTQYPASFQEPEERDFYGVLELDEAEPPLSEGDAFDLINGRAFCAVWPEDDFPW